MAVRKRFNAAEKELLAELQPGDRVEWRNVSQWHPADITSPVVVTEDGWQHITGVNRANTRTVTSGQAVRITPGGIRRAA